MRLALLALPLLAACASEPTTPKWDMQSNIPRRYDAPFLRRAPVIDGKLTDGIWSDARWTTEFVDIEGDAKPRPRFRTKAKIAWDDDYLYIGAQLIEPHLWATLTEHDSVIFHDNDFEVFIDPNGDAASYFEYEVNALGTDWDLYLPTAYRDGGEADNSWEIEGLQSAVHLNGSLNDPTDLDQSWTVELAIPWSAFKGNAHTPLPPNAGETWRINFSRVQWPIEIGKAGYAKPRGATENNWVWTPQFQIDMHQPEHWGHVTFTK